MKAQICRRMVPTFLGLAMAASLGIAPGTASAAPLKGGDWLFRVGVSYADPNDNTSNPRGGLPAGSDVSIGSDTRPTVMVEYMFNENLGFELLAAAPFKHDIDGAGALSGAGKIGDIKHVPPTLSLNWHFVPDSNVRPYVGIGLNYTFIYDENTSGPLEGTSLTMDNSFGAAAQAGLDLDMGSNWFFNAGVRYIQINSTAKFSNGYRLDVDIDPWIYTVGVGTSF